MKQEGAVSRLSVSDDCLLSDQSVVVSHRVSLIEESAMTGLMQKIFALQSNLLSGFEAYDTNNDGRLFAN